MIYAIKRVRTGELLKVKPIKDEYRGEILHLSLEEDSNNSVIFTTEDLKLAQSVVGKPWAKTSSVYGLTENATSFYILYPHNVLKQPGGFVDDPLEVVALSFNNW